MGCTRCVCVCVYLQSIILLLNVSVDLIDVGGQWGFLFALNTTHELTMKQAPHNTRHKTNQHEQQEVHLVILLPLGRLLSRLEQHAMGLEFLQVGLQEEISNARANHSSQHREHTQFTMQ
jgi:hypothetical protein